MASSLPLMARRLEGKVALIMGGARGIAEVTARLFREHGAKLEIADIKCDDERGGQQSALCAELGGASVAAFSQCDVSIEGDVEAAVDMAVATFGKLDVLINNVAIIDEKKLSIVENDVSEFEKVTSVNLTGTFLGTKHGARVMIPNRNGSIINLGSVASSVGGVVSHAYTATKHGVIGLTKNTAVELGQYGIRVNCVSPYFIPTPLSLKGFNFKNENDYSSIYSNLSDRRLKSQDVAQALLYLASDESKYVSGHNLAVDGGFTITNPAFKLLARPAPPSSEFGQSHP